MYDFANILLSGKCNARCPFCIGKQIDPELNRDNLDEYPPRNLGRFLEMVREAGVRQVVVTGTNTDPQLYRHEERLLGKLREHLPAGTQISLHTNGRLALRKMALLNQYDRVTLSLPSFEAKTYFKMMGVNKVPDLYEIMRINTTPLKISCVVSEINAAEMGSFLGRCAGMGVKRVVLRKLYGERRSCRELLGTGLRAGNQDLLQGRELVRRMLGNMEEECYRGNPVVEVAGMEVTLWDFGQTQSTALNLYSNGLISSNYRLAETRCP